MAAHKVTPPHGTRARYLHRDPEIRCRLECCRTANAAYMRGYRHYGPTTVRVTGHPRARQLRIRLEDS